MDVSYPDLDVQYSPSRWSNRFCACQILERHVQFVGQESEKARKTIPCTLNVPYGPSINEKLDIFGVDLPNDAPLCVFIHGGFWQELNKDLSSYPTVQLYNNNFKTIIIGYDLCPNVGLGDITIEIQRSFEYIVNYAKCNHSRGIYLMGHSAGAHLVANLLSTTTTDSNSSSNAAGDEEENIFQSLVKEVHLISGVYDLRPLIKTYVNANVGMDAADAETLSPLLRSFKNTGAKIFVSYAEHDSEAFKGQSKSFHAHLSSIGLRSQLMEIRGKDHFDVVEDLIREDHPIIRLIVSQNI